MARATTPAISGSTRAWRLYRPGAGVGHARGRDGRNARARALRPAYTCRALAGACPLERSLCAPKVPARTRHRPPAEAVKTKIGAESSAPLSSSRLCAVKLCLQCGFPPLLPNCERLLFRSPLPAPARLPHCGFSIPPRRSPAMPGDDSFVPWVQVSSGWSRMRPIFLLLGCGLFPGIRLRCSPATLVEPVGVALRSSTMSPKAVSYHHRQPRLPSPISFQRNRSASRCHLLGKRRSSRGRAARSNSSAGHRPRPGARKAAASLPQTHHPSIPSAGASSRLSRCNFTPVKSASREERTIPVRAARDLLVRRERSPEGYARRLSAVSPAPARNGTDVRVSIPEARRGPFAAATVSVCW